jgi:hypothetical protein
MTKPLTFLALGASLLLSSCAATRIGQITADPLRYRNRTVHVEGTVTQSGGLFDIGGYQLTDGTGRIYVISTQGVPPKGARVKVAGNVVNGITVGPKSFGTAIQAHNQHVSY